MKQSIEDWIDYLNKFGCSTIVDEIEPNGHWTTRINGIIVNEKLRAELHPIAMELFLNRKKIRIYRMSRILEGEEK